MRSNSPRLSSQAGERGFRHARRQATALQTVIQGILGITVNGVSRGLRRPGKLRTATIAGAIAVAACVEDPPISPTANTAGVPTAGSPTLQVMAAPADAKSYVIDFTGTQLPADLAAQVSAAGGTVTTSIDQIGVAVAASSDPGFAARAGKIKGVSTVTEDIQVQWVPQDRVVEAGEVTDAGSFDATAAFGADRGVRRKRDIPPRPVGS